MLTEAECREVRSLYDDESNFRSRIDMQRYRFGRGRCRLRRRFGIGHGDGLWSGFRVRGW